MHEALELIEIVYREPNHDELLAKLKKRYPDEMRQIQRVYGSPPVPVSRRLAAHLRTMQVGEVVKVSYRDYSPNSLNVIASRAGKEENKTFRTLKDEHSARIRRMS